MNKNYDYYITILINIIVNHIGFYINRLIRVNDALAYKKGALFI